MCLSKTKLCDLQNFNSKLFIDNSAFKPNGVDRHIQNISSIGAKKVHSSLEHTGHSPGHITC